MEIYLIRHAHALAGDDDAQRPLGKKGCAQVKAMGRFLRENRLVRVHDFWHSPLVRSVETARLLAKHLRTSAPLKQVAGLLHDDDPRIMAKRLGKSRRPVAVVGHEPHLSALASQLVANRGQPPLFVLGKCAVLALERRGSRWTVRWLVAPRALR